MADLDALHAAVVATPEDEAARLAYAAAVAATDPARAELIELQLQLAHERKAHLEPAADGYVRQHALRKAHGDRWASGVSQLVTNWMFRRGFVEEVTLDAAKFLATAPELYRRAPILHLTLTGARPVARELFASPHLARIVSLRLDGNQLDDDDAVALAASPHLGKLAWLDLGKNAIGPRGLEALAATDRLPRLQYLGFADNAVADPTPARADEYDVDSPAATALQAKHGRRPWLSASPPRLEWPPERDAV